MAITISGENNNDRILAQDGVIDSISGFNIAGIITASSFTGDLTGDVTGDLTGNVTGNINNTTLLLQTGGTERIRITSNGRVGINESAPLGKLHVKSGDSGATVGASADELVLESSANTGMTILSGTSNEGAINFGDSGANNVGKIVYMHNGNYMYFKTNAVERLRINSSGNVGVGTNNVSTRLEIEGTSALTNHNQTILIRDSVSDNATGRGGNIGFGAYVEGTMRSLAGIGAVKSNSGTGFDGDLALYARRNGVGPLDERMRIKYHGNVGIGTDNPGYKVDVHYSGGEDGIRILNRGTGSGSTSMLRLGNDENVNAAFLMLNSSGYGSVGGAYNLVLGHGLNRDIVFSTGGSEKVRIKSGGTVGINDSSPNTYFKLDVNGHTNIVGDIALPTTNRIYFGNSDTAFIKGEHGGSGYLAFGANNEKMRLTRAGYLGIGTDNPQDTLDISRHANHGIILRRPAGLSNPGQISLKCMSYGVAEFRSNRHMNLHFDDDNGNNQFFRIYSDDTEVFNISSAGVLNIPAGIGPQLRFENQHSVTTDAAISTYDDAAGTLLCLGSNFYFNSSGSETRYNTGEESSAIVINRNGTINLKTGGTGETAPTRLGIDSDGTVILKNTAAANSRSDFLGSLKPISQIASTWNAYHSLTRHDSGSSYGPYLMLAKNRNNLYNSNGIVQDNDELGNISFQGNDGSVFREGARIRGEIDGTPGSNQMPTALGFWTNAGSGVVERARITKDGDILINTNSINAGGANPKLSIDGGDSNIGVIQVQAGGGETSGDLAGISFSHGNTGDMARPKAAIAFNRNASYGRGDLCFYVDNTTDNNTVSSADLKLNITKSGSVVVQNGNIDFNTAGTGALYNPGAADASGITFHSNEVKFYTQNTERFKLDTGGSLRLQQNFFLRTNAPTIYLQDTDHHAAMIHQNSGLFYVLRASGTDSTVWQQYNSQWPLYIRMSDNHAYFGGNVYSAGTLLTGSSDSRLKKNLVKIQTPLEKISKLTGYNFDWNDNVMELGFTPDIPTNDVGLIAQDVQEVAPQAVQHAPFDKEYDKETETHKSRSGEKYLTVQYEKLVPLLVEAIKELKAEVDALKSS